MIYDRVPSYTFYSFPYYVSPPIRRLRVLLYYSSTISHFQHLLTGLSDPFLFNFFATWREPMEKYKYSRSPRFFFPPFVFICCFWQEVVFIFPDPISLERVQPAFMYSIDSRIDIWLPSWTMRVPQRHRPPKLDFVFISVTFHWIGGSWNKTKTKSQKRICYYFPLCRRRRAESKGEKKGTTLTSKAKYLDLPG